MQATPHERWEVAQDYERAWWAARVDAVDPRFYRTYALALERELAPHLTIERDTHILEIGSGAAGSSWTGKAAM